MAVGRSEGASAGPWLVPVGLFASAAVLGLLGEQGVALLLVAAGFVALILASVLRRRRSTDPLPALEPAQAADLRAERERSGEVAAVRRLRTQHPGMSMGDAVRLVREL